MVSSLAAVRSVAATTATGLLFFLLLLQQQPSSLVAGQVAATGAQNAIKQMNLQGEFEKQNILRLAKRESSLATRAEHVRSSTESFVLKRDLVERGSVQFPDGETIRANEARGEQPIDPRTPKGFGDPFFRALNVELKVELASIVSVHEGRKIRDRNGGTLVAEISSGWKLLLGRGTLSNPVQFHGSFMSLLAVAPNKIIRRQCDSCAPSHADIYYKRTGPRMDGMDRSLLQMMLGGKYGFHASDCGTGNKTCNVANECNVDFTLHSTYTDAINGTNPWKACDTRGYGEGNDMFTTTDTIGFPGYSGPNNPSYDQYNGGGQQDFAFYIEDTPWIPVMGIQLLNNKDVEEQNVLNAPATLRRSPHTIIRRRCLDCSEPYQDIFYRRILPVPDGVDLWRIIGLDFSDREGNVNGDDYALYSTYADAINIENPWYCGDEAGATLAPTPFTFGNNGVTQAESYSLKSAKRVRVKTRHAGYRGGGYVDMGTSSKPRFVEWDTIDGRQGGPCTFRFRYAVSGSKASRPGRLTINGDNRGIVHFYNRNDWTLYTYEEMETQCDAGMQTVRITVNGRRGPHIDTIEVVFPGDPPPPSGGRRLQAGPDTDAYRFEGPDQNCPYDNGSTRLFRVGAASPLTFEECHIKCRNTLTCRYFSLGSETDVGVCIGCTADAVLAFHPGHNAYKLLDPEDLDGGGGELRAIATSTKWRLWASESDSLRGWLWDVNNLEYRSGTDCSGTKFDGGTPVSSGFYPDGSYGPENVFDALDSTAWGGRPDAGGDLWIGMEFPVSREVRCVSFRDSPDNGVARVTVQAWEESTGSWQSVKLRTHRAGETQTIAIDPPRNGPGEIPNDARTTSPTEKIGFPGRCRPHINNNPDVFEGQWTKSNEHKIWRGKRGVRNWGFYIEGESVPETGVWMTENDEMEAFLNPGAVLDADVAITCDGSVFSIDTESHYAAGFPTELKPYVVRGRDDAYAGWYDIQGCGQCTDWCGWFSSDDTFDGGMDPRYQSWTSGNDFFACLSGSSRHTEVHTSAVDPSPFYASFVPYQLNQINNPYASFLNFFPLITKCSSAYVVAPALPEYEYVGCYVDCPDRVLPDKQTDRDFVSCYNECRSLGKHFFGRQEYDQCYCGGSSKDDTSYRSKGPTANNYGSGSSTSQSGMEHNVLDSAITANGWEKCHTSSYDDPTSSLTEIMADCQGTNVMYGCRETTSDTWKVIGYGDREKAFVRDNGNGIVDGAVQWYLSEEKGGMGFAGATDGLDLNPCDRRELGSNNRLCWHLENDTIDKGWRCGDTAWLNFESGWERSIWTTSNPASSISFSRQECSGCEGGGYIGECMNCVYRIKYEEETNPSGTCEHFDGFDIPNILDEFPSDLLPYKYQVPVVDDPYSGYYDVQRCGKCNDFCFWIGPSGDGSGVNPEYKAKTGTDYFACKLAGGYGTFYDLTERDYFENNFPYQKCEGEGAPTPDYRKEKYIGCFNDQSSTRALPVRIGEGQATLTIEACADACRDKGYHYFSRQEKGFCYCGGQTADDHSYNMHGEIDPTSAEFTCSACDGTNIGHLKQCVFQILDQYDPKVERKKHECSHIPSLNVRRHCYVSCRDAQKDYKNLLACQTLKVTGLKHLNNEIAAWNDSPACDTKNCLKETHPLGDDVGQDSGIH